MHLRITCIVFLVLVSHLQQSASAGIVDVSDSLQLIGPPPSVLDGEILSDTTASVFAERRNFETQQPLTFGITIPGTWPNGPVLDNGIGTLPAGTRLDSYFVHFQSISGTDQNPVLVSGSITFDRDVLGIATTNLRLTQSDSVLGFPGTMYDTATERQLEITAGGILGIGGNDRISLSEDRRTVTIDFGNIGGGDQFRIVTASVPEPASWLLMLVGAALVLTIRQRRR